MKRYQRNLAKHHFVLRNSFFQTYKDKFTLIVVLTYTVFTLAIPGWGAENNNSNEGLLNQYIQSKGKSVIIFDESNIKQFWLDKTVTVEQDIFNVQLTQTESHLFTSEQLKIQLINVDETQDCKIEIISNPIDYSFSVLNNNSKVISTSSISDNFLDYQITDSYFHLEDTNNLTFSLVFSSNNLRIVPIKKIILSFSNNKNSSFLTSPGELQINEKCITGVYTSKKEHETNSFSVTGTRTAVYSTKKIYITDNELSSSITVKNIGSIPTKVYFGYAPYTKKGEIIKTINSPYKNINKTARVKHADIGKNIIVLDSYLDWTKGCYLALDAKENLSDYPNFSLINSKILEIKKIDDNRSEVVLEKPLTHGIKENTLVRVNSPDGSTYIYMNDKILNPGDEITFKSTIQKDDHFYQFSMKAFSHGTHYVIPLILSNSINRNEENTILISDFKISY